MCAFESEGEKRGYEMRARVWAGVRDASSCNLVIRLKRIEDCEEFRETTGPTLRDLASRPPLAAGVSSRNLEPVLLQGSVLYVGIFGFKRY